MKDPIINHINENREAFDNDLPDNNLWNNIHLELHPEENNRKWFWYKIAAVFVAILGFSYILKHNSSVVETKETAIADVQPDTLRHVIRGGSWKDIGHYLQTNNIAYEYQDGAKSYIGFRNVNTYLGKEGLDVGYLNTYGQNNAIKGHEFTHDLSPGQLYSGLTDNASNKSDGPVKVAANKTNQEITGGTYTMTIMDANGCVSSNDPSTYAWNFGDGDDGQHMVNQSKPTNGDFTTYNGMGYIDMEGEFKDGKLYNGSHHVYDDFGNLIKTEIYAKGVFDGYSYLSPYENPGYYYEQYEAFEENDFVSPLDEPLSTFGVDVDAAGYSNMRRYINDGYLPPKDAVKLEEMINYFEYDLPEPTGDHPFSITTEVGACPWNSRNKLVQICIKGKSVPKEDLPPSNLVFLLDVSGSMEDVNKLPLLKQGFEMLVDELRPEDRVSIVVYAGAAGEILPPTSGKKKEEILNALNSLSAGGSTAGGEGILLAYKLAEENFIKGGNNRIILATDGDFNVGVSDDAALVELIEEKRKSGVFLSVLGFGEGNLQSSKMEKLADNGNGNYSYIDNILEAKKVLVTEFGGTLFTIAKDVKLQLEFNPKYVGNYRLLGYENRLLAPEDFADDTKDAGEIGSGHTVVAFYEVMPGNKKTAKAAVDLKYQETLFTADNRSAGELLTINFRYKEPDGNTSKLITRTVPNKVNGKLSKNFLFASAVAEFGLIIRESDYKGNASFEKLIERAKHNKGEDINGYRSEFVKLAEMGQLLWKDYEDYQEAFAKLK